MTSKVAAKELQAKVKLKILKPVSTVFEGIIDPKHMSHYFISSGSARLEAGKTLTWTWTDYGDTPLAVDVRVQHVDRDKRISFLWKASGVEALVSMTLEPINPNTTLVTITEGGWDKDDKGIARLVEQTHGWVHFLCGLKAYLEHGINIRIGAF